MGRDFKKETNEAAEQKFPGQQGCRIIFSEVRDASLLETYTDVGQNFL